MMLSFEEHEELIAQGITAFDKLHEEKKRKLQCFVDYISDDKVKIDKLRVILSKILRELNEAIEKLKVDIIPLKRILEDYDTSKIVRATPIEEVKVQNLLNEIKKLERLIDKTHRSLESLIEQRPHYVYYMYHETWEEGARDFLKKIHSRKRTIFDFEDMSEVKDNKILHSKDNKIRCEDMTDVDNCCDNVTDVQEAEIL